MRKIAKKVLARTTIDDKIFQASKQLHDTMKKNITTAILAAFGFMIALVWRDVIKEGVNKLVEMFSMTGDGFSFTVLTAFLTTIISVIGIIYFSRWGGKK